ncbi:MAG TPA: tetratricopeptide repeat protein [Pseudonocardia sp.]
MIPLQEIDRYRMAGLHLDMGDPLEALKLLEPMADGLREHAAGQLLLGRAYYHSAQLGKAQEALERAVSLAPTDAYMRFILGRTLQRRSRHEEAGVQFRIAAALEDRPEYSEHRDAHARDTAA